MIDCQRTHWTPSLLLVSALVLLACDKPETASKPTPSPSASANVAPTRPKVADEDLAAAVEQAARELNTPLGADSASDVGPPPNGVLGPARAQAEAVRGAAPKFTLATNGSEPRIALGAAPLPEKQPGQIEVAVRTGPRAALPTVVLRLEGSTPKSAAGDAKVAVDAGSGVFALNVVAAGLGKSQPGEIPASTEALIGKLKGTRFDAQLKGNLLLGSLRFERSKATGPELDLLLTAASDALTSAVAHLPAEPVGQGATWLVSSRETFMGTDVVAYRMFKLEELTPDGALVSLNTKRYAAGGGLGLPGIVDNQIEEFESSDESRLRFVLGQRLPVEGQILQRLGAVISSSGNQEPVQIEARSLFAFPPASQASSKP